MATLLGGGGFARLAPSAAQAADVVEAHPFPRVEAIPEADGQAAFQVDGVERLRFHFARRHIRPFWYPVVGPAGRSVTRITHPHDPHGHSHHKSVWVAHHDVNGFSFWSDRSGTRILYDRVESYVDGRMAAAMIVRNHWLDPTGKRLLTETRTTRLHSLAGNESLIEIELMLEATDGPVTFGKTPFGFLGVRVAKMMGVRDGGGTIRNSEGGMNEKGVFWKSARWVDYSGRVAPKTINGITLMDHPDNPRHPAYFHVRDDGWMGTSFCLYEPFHLDKGHTLNLRYGLYVHGKCNVGQIERRWSAFASRAPRARAE